MYEPKIFTHSLWVQTSGNPMVGISVTSHAFEYWLAEAKVNFRPFFFMLDPPPSPSSPQGLNQSGGSVWQFKEKESLHFDFCDFCISIDTWECRLSWFVIVDGMRHYSNMIQQPKLSWSWKCPQHGEVTPLSSWEPRANKVCYPYIICHR